MSVLDVPNGQIINGSALEIIDSLPPNYYQTCITSPPYWGLRDYGINDQVGAEQLLDDYIKNITKIFSKIKHVLKDDGILWLNIGDSYTSGNRTWRDGDKKNPGRAMSYRPPTPEGLKPKDLIGVPWKIAFALQNDGWYLRSDIIWNKPNCQPESVKDRPTRSHEYIFMLTKSKKYYYDYEAIKEYTADHTSKKNKRTVWNINTEGFKGAHFAVFPTALVKTCLLASTKISDTVIDPFFGSGTLGSVCQQYNRRFTGIELNQDYTRMSYNRLKDTSDLFFESKSS